MNQSLVDQIVSNVMDQLHRGSSRTDNVPAMKSSLPTTSSIPGPAEHRVAPTKSDPKSIDKPTVIELAAPVITAQLLESSVTAGQPIKISRRSIITPSARDWLNSKRIDWIRGERSGGTSANPISARWMLILQSVTPTVKALHDGLKRQPEGWTIELAGQPAEAAAMAIGSISKAEHDGCVIISNFAEVIVCRANRNDRVRAAVISDRKQLELTMTHLGANVVCINPMGRTFIEMRNLLRDCSTLKPTVPAGW